MIKLHDVAYGYGGGPLFTDVTLDLAPGSFHFLTGPSGVGKTTLLKLCTGDLRPTAGTIDAFDQNLSTLSRDQLAMTRRRVGVVHQDCTFIDHLSIAENIALPMTVAGRFDIEDELIDLLKWVGLSQKAGVLPPELSGGERQRAALARAVIQSPDVIVADEPTGNVDWDMSERMLALLVDLNKMGKTAIVATHDMQLVRHAKTQVAARVLRLSGGTLTQAGAEL